MGQIGKIIFLLISTSFISAADTIADVKKFCKQHNRKLIRKKPRRLLTQGIIDAIKRGDAVVVAQWVEKLKKENQQLLGSSAKDPLSFAAGCCVKKLARTYQEKVREFAPKFPTELVSAKRVKGKILQILEEHHFLQTDQQRLRLEEPTLENTVYSSGASFGNRPFVQLAQERHEMIMELLIAQRRYFDLGKALDEASNDNFDLFMKYCSPQELYGSFKRAGALKHAQKLLQDKSGEILINTQNKHGRTILGQVLEVLPALIGNNDVTSDEVATRYVFIRASYQLINKLSSLGAQLSSVDKSMCCAKNDPIVNLIVQGLADKKVS